MTRSATIRDARDDACEIADRGGATTGHAGDNAHRRSGKRHPSVIPAKAGIHFDFRCATEKQMDSGFRRNDGIGRRAQL
jgi:hypothetical protein